MTNCNTGGSNSVRLNSCKIARKSQGFSHVILLAIFVFCKWSKGGDSRDLHRFCFKNFPLPSAWLSDWIGAAAHRTSSRHPYQRSDLHGNQLLHVVSHALWLRSGVPCRKQHYIRCGLFVQRCDLQGQRFGARNEYGSHPLVHGCHWYSCEHGNVCNGNYRRRASDWLQFGSAPPCEKAEYNYYRGRIRKAIPHFCHLSGRCRAGNPSAAD